MKTLEQLKADSPLGKNTTYAEQYDPTLLFAISRQDKRTEIGIEDALPFYGTDVWNAFELSWLNLKGKPQVAVATIRVACESPNIFESKSIKLYLNSFNHSQFASVGEVRDLLQKDLSVVADSSVQVELNKLGSADCRLYATLPGSNIDDLDIEIDCYQTQPEFLTVEDEVVSEVLSSDLLKSNCLITNQPDWGSVSIAYSGKRIQHEGLLRYIVSMRNHNEFHEQCVERIFMDITRHCAPKTLTVFARYTRRGGIDINPYRSSDKNFVAENHRLIRQ